MAQTRTVSKQRASRGQTAYLAGRMAEEGVAARYDRDGYDLLAERWRGAAGEIDLVFQRNGVYVFVEVKSAATRDLAAERLCRRQMDRICLAASEYVGGLPDGQLTEMRFDAALVDSFGRIDIIENAFGLN